MCEKHLHEVHLRSHDIDTTKTEKIYEFRTRILATRQASNEGCEDLRRQGQDLINLHTWIFYGFMFWERINLSNLCRLIMEFWCVMHIQTLKPEGPKKVMHDIFMAWFRKPSRHQWVPYMTIWISPEVIPGICKTWPIGNDLSGPEACGHAVMHFCCPQPVMFCCLLWNISGVTTFLWALGKCMFLRGSNSMDMFWLLAVRRQRNSCWKFRRRSYWNPFCFCHACDSKNTKEWRSLHPDAIRELGLFKAGRIFVASSYQLQVFDVQVQKSWSECVELKLQEHLERNTRHLEGTRIARSAAMNLGLDFCKVSSRFLRMFCRDWSVHSPP